MPGIFLRRARIRNLKEGLVQSARIEALENDAKDDAERFQDYGFAANVVDGQGLVINAGGHTIVLRMDRLAERPQLPAFEVRVWHKDGHHVALKAGKLVEVNCDTFRVNAAVKVELNTPAMTASGTLGVTGRVTAGGVTAAGKQLDGHNHNETGVITGPNN